MKKNFLLDTNILMQSPDSLFVFQDNNIYICHTTLEELDNLKTAAGETGYNARNAIRTIYSLRQYGNLTKGIDLPTGGTFAIVEDVGEKSEVRNFRCNDDVIIATAAHIGAVLVTNDIGMLVKADVRGIKSEMFKNEQVSDEALKYTGRKTIYVDDMLINLLYQNKSICSEDLNVDLVVNEFLVLKGKTDEHKSALAYFDGKDVKIISPEEMNVVNLFTPKNTGQRFLIKALMAPVKDIPLVVVRGAAGTGKTMAALAAGLYGINNGVYNKILLLRPNVKFDDDIGFLPGTELEKIDPLLRPFKDNLEALMPNKKEATKEIENMFSKGMLRAESLAYIRGRSITNTFIIVDEAQNSTKLQIKSIITRAGMGSKIVIIGDPDQIDNPKLNKQTNGLVYAADKMRGSSLCMQLVLENKECVRCPLALDAVKRL